MALARESFGEELAEVSVAQNGDFEGLGFEVLGAEVRLVVVRLGGVDRTDAESIFERDMEREGRGASETEICLVTEKEKRTEEKTGRKER